MLAGLHPFFVSLGWVSPHPPLPHCGMGFTLLKLLRPSACSSKDLEQPQAREMTPNPTWPGVGFPHLVTLFLSRLFLSMTVNIDSALFYY